MCLRRAHCFAQKVSLASFKLEEFVQKLCMSCALAQALCRRVFEIRCSFEVPNRSKRSTFWSSSRAAQESNGLSWFRQFVHGRLFDASPLAEWPASALGNDTMSDSEKLFHFQSMLLNWMGKLPEVSLTHFMRLIVRGAEYEIQTTNLYRRYIALSTVACHPGS